MGKRSNYREFVVIIELCLTFENWNISYLHKFGSTSVKNDLFIRIDKGIEIVSWISFKIFVGMLFIPELLLLFRDFIRP